jgi:coproporphyrinogen III oxidase
MQRKTEIASWFRQLQVNICKQLEEEDTIGKFSKEKWERDGGGGGYSNVMQNGKVIEKGGVNFSAVHGLLPDKIKQALSLKKSEFFATGVSIVIHPENPFVPIIHMNVRYFEIEGETWWFGGGIDLTPIYVDKQDAAFFHTQLKNVCDKYDKLYYPEFKKWADDYFYIPHRNETRGIGGIFFDKLNDDSKHNFTNRYEFVKAVGESFAPIYCRLMNINKTKTYSENEKNWQLIRRGRYAEFNLVYDKGTKFGLDTSGRTESILMSLPPMATWLYNHQPQKGSNEYDTSLLLKKGINWI